MQIRNVSSFAVLSMTLMAYAQSVQELHSPGHGSSQQAFIKTAQQNKFAANPVLPGCYTSAAERGDPKTGPSVTLSKLAAGCKVPWHTHSAYAQVLFVSGTFQLQMKGQMAQTLTQGAYAYVPAHHEH